MKPGKGSFNPWPFGIVIAFAFFIAGAGVLVVLATSGRSDLVTADYYEQELRYQQRIDQIQRTRPLEGWIEIAYSPESREVVLRLPAAHAAEGAHGEVVMYRPSSKGLDRTVALAIDATGRQTIAAADLQPGFWRVRVLWQVASKDFYVERELIVR
jgi:nitrogen fixation protein FixH